jgi:Ca-activated chloride channel homolog
MLIRTISRSLALLACSAALPLSLVPSAFAAAQDAQTEEAEDENADVLIVTGNRIRQGGAQDIKHFRSMAMTEQTLPRPESLTVEGLMGEHDLTLPGTGKCDQLFCLVGASMPAALPSRPDDRMFVGLGFDSNINGDSWKRAPLSLMAVVDRSGSMSGKPIETVKAALRKAVEQLGDNDRLGIAIYGTNSLIHLTPTDVRGNKEKLLAAIDAIQIDGSTNMEAGLKIGYDGAFAEAESFKGKVRMMLFTDEQPNTGRTDAASFMGMASEASRRGIGLTTIGVGVQYDGALATKISSVRGGNLFFLTDQEDAQKTMQAEFRNMVSEVAHDVTITMKPRDGYAISGVFGVPDGLMVAGKDGAMSITVPTAFLSSNGGGIFASIGKAKDRQFLPAEKLDVGEKLLDVSLIYVSALDGAAGSDQMAIGVGEKGAVARNLSLAHSLVDQYLTLNAATTAYHQSGDAKKAFALLDGLDQRMDNANLSELKDERELVQTIRSKAALFAGYGGEVPKEMKPLQVVGKWRVISHNGVDDLSRGDVIEMTQDGDFITYFKKPRRGKDQMYQSFEINEHQLYVRDGNLMVGYRVIGDTLRLQTLDRMVQIVLRREPAEQDVIS